MTSESVLPLVAIKILQTIGYEKSAEKNQPKVKSKLKQTVGLKQSYSTLVPLPIFFDFIDGYVWE